MSTKPIFSVNCTSSATRLRACCVRARLPFAVAALLLSAQVQAVLPMPASLVMTGELAAAPTTTADISQSLTPQTDGTLHSQNSEAEQLLATWRQQVQAHSLAEHTTWRRLLYFLDDKKSLFNKDAPKSLIDSPAFFLSTDGQHDAGAELDALLVALAEQMVAPPESKPSSDAQSAICRFPARTHWLTKRLGIDSSSLQADCPELTEWMAMLNPEQLSIMFAEEYLDNPISAFAHTLLRIDSPISAADPSQIHHAYALNDTVDGDPDDAFAVYAIKATSGGYNNRIEIDPYPEKLAKYLKDDERDAWTYQLDLTPAEVQQIILHVWETKDLEIPYYFTTDNCASEILRLIDVVRPEQDLLSQLPYVVIPSDVVKLLDEESLLADARYTPSDSTVRQAELNNAKAAALGYHNLTNDDASNIQSAARNVASSISAGDKKTIIDHGIIASDNNPIDRHPLQVAQIGAGQRGDNGYLDVGLRLGFHDTLDRASGFPQFFNLEALAATVRFYETGNSKDHEPNRVVLENFTILRGRSFNPVNTAKQGKTWGASVEATRVNDGSQPSGRDHLVGSAGYETGWSWALGSPKAGSGEMPPQLCYALLSGKGQAGRGIHKGFRIGAGVNTGCDYQINNQLRAQAQLQLPYWYHGSSDDPDARSHYWQPISSVGLQYDINKNQAVRINASYEWQERIDANDDIQLSYRRYF
ncbi:Lnb N-terminal periplasmic domain-containing protein [Psychrobacter celer]|uniref:Lnb N-terminal periplasmic domain-containing protein n=1 Tax=Psychrobacter celer TaxID=306572 RepID=UPI003FD0AF8F